MQKHAASAVCFRFSTELRADDIKYFFLKFFQLVQALTFFIRP